MAYCCVDRRCEQELGQLPPLRERRRRAAGHAAAASWSIPTAARPSIRRLTHRTKATRRHVARRKPIPVASTRPRPALSTAPGTTPGPPRRRGSKPKHDTGKMNRPLSFGDARVFFPESFVIPRQRAAEVVLQNPYSLPSSHSSPEHMELPDPVVSGSGSPQEQVGAISPPAQYAHSAPRYGRRCGSGFARDSGGSSGHYTQRSAPPHARRRTDSGSSTQHDHHSRYNSYGEEPAELPLDVYPSAPPQFQDGPSSPQAAQRPHATRSGIHFQESYRFSQPTSAPPPQFQDDPPVYDYGDYECAHHAPCVSLCHNAARKDFPRYHEPAQTQYQETRRRARIDETNEYVHAAAAAAAQVQGPGTPKQGYRNTEPPSVVERNARIIKWLCQCRKTQHQHQQHQQQQQHQQHQQHQ
ncbi:hypothetical protein ACJJTC_014026 [Scirpophaga incertulas]